MSELAAAQFPVWLTVVSSLSLPLAVALAITVTVEVIRRPVPMTVMNVVWPLTMLFGSAAWFLLYRRSRADTEQSMAFSVSVGASHCGAGCAAGDLLGEFGTVLVPGLLAVAGLHRAFADPIFAHWVIDFVVAYLAGIGFQYFSIAPMRHLGISAGLWAAVKADTFSITAWQVGMYGVMGLGQLLVLPHLFGGRAAVLSPEFWFLMQVAMLGGFVTAYPVNWLLIRVGVKERM